MCTNGLVASRRAGTRSSNVEQERESGATLDRLANRCQLPEVLVRFPSQAASIVCPFYCFVREHTSSIPRLREEKRAERDSSFRELG